MCPHQIQAVFTQGYGMAKPFAAALLSLGLLLAGCASARTQTQAGQAAIGKSREQAPEHSNVQEQVLPQTTVSEPNEAKPQPLPVPGNDVTAAGTGTIVTDEPGRVSQPEDTGRRKNAIADAPKRTDPDERAAVKASEPNNVRRQEPNDVKAAEPNHVTPPPPEPGQTIHQASEPSALVPFYEKYGEILKAYVQEDGSVDYAALDRHRLELKTLLMRLDELDPNADRDWSRQEKLAFWINAYNVKMLEIITRNYPIQSSWWLRLTWPPSDIRHIKGIWTDYKFIVMDEEFTLAEVEQRLFHRTFDDPRIYLAILYAARSGPPLRREPYRGAGLDRQLDEQVRRFLASPQGLRIDRRNMVVRLSALFKPSWRGKEFAGRFGTDRKFKNRDPETRAVLNFLAGYLPRDDVNFLEVENYTIEYMNFDWRLNDTAGDY